MSTVDLGQYAQWYNFATSEQMMELTGMDPYDEDVQSVLDSYGLNYVGWAVAKDEYFDTLMDSGIEYCLVAQDPETQAIDLYEWVGKRLYPAIDDIMSIDFDGYGDEDMFYESMDVKTALSQALNEALIDYDEVEFMDDMELEEFLQDNLNDCEQQVLSELGIILEPSGSGAIGSFFLMDEETGQELAEIDFQEYNDKELELATECDDVNQYKERYKAWVEGFKAVEESLTEEVSESPLRQYSRDPYGFDGWERELKQMVDEGKLSWEQACMICLAAVDNLKYVDEIVAKMGMYNESLK